MMMNSQECRDRAAALRVCADATASADYKIKFEHLAVQWEKVGCMARSQDEMARRLEFAGYSIEIG